MSYNRNSDEALGKNLSVNSDAQRPVEPVVMRDDQLCERLRNNSSSPSSYAAHRIESMKVTMMAVREIIAAQDINVFGAVNNDEMEWSLRDEAIDALTKQINA